VSRWLEDNERGYVLDSVREEPSSIVMSVFSLWREREIKRDRGSHDEDAKPKGAMPSDKLECRYLTYRALRRSISEVCSDAKYHSMALLRNR
jgi:ADP-ribose pyrophosphatase YjhB (NUDIX family)